MSITQIFLLAVIQGVTEFLPVSSSGHLNLLHGLTAFPDQGVLLDVAVHSGTLLAVMLYFRKDAARLVCGGLKILSRGPADTPGNGTLAARQVIIATLPILPAGALLVATGWMDALRDPLIVAWATIVFAIPLYLADRFAGTGKTVLSTGGRGAFWIGLAQTAALIPGASRAGVTITAARALGVARQDTARFSMLLSIPVILIFTGLGLADLVVSAQYGMLGAAALAAGLSALTAMATIHLFLKMTARLTLLPFVLYRLALGACLLIML